MKQLMRGWLVLSLGACSANGIDEEAVESGSEIPVDRVQAQDSSGTSSAARNAALEESVSSALDQISATPAERAEVATLLADVEEARAESARLVMGYRDRTGSRQETGLIEKAVPAGVADRLDPARVNRAFASLFGQERHLQYRDALRALRDQAEHDRELALRGPAASKVVVP